MKNVIKFSRYTYGKIKILIIFIFPRFLCNVSMGSIFLEQTVRKFIYKEKFKENTIFELGLVLLVVSG